MLSLTKWNKQELVNKWLDGDIGTLFARANIAYSPAKNESVRISPRKDISCGICLEVFDHEVRYHFLSILYRTVNNVFFIKNIKKYSFVIFDKKDTWNLMCGHKFCQSCWRQYLTLKITDRSHGGAVSIMCPDSECNIFADDDVIMGLIKDESLIAQYKRLITNHFVQVSLALIFIATSIN